MRGWVEKMVVVCGKERRKKHGTKRDRKQEKKTFLLGDAKFITTTRTNCGVGSTTEGL